ncbi:MAG TPA: DUF6471 domain-containing protein [Rhizomicrobium sp.]|nr:DUF6471 domain-containing protein [Rhizomicrobium sp.]
MADFESRTHEWVTRAIRAEMVRRGITFGELAEQIVLVGGDENERNLRNKIARGTFSAALFAQCLAAMGCKNLTIDLLDQLYAGTDDVDVQAGATRAERIQVLRAVREAINRDTPAKGDSPGLKEVIEALDATDITPFTSGAVSLEEIVKRVRQTLEKTSR